MTFTFRLPFETTRGRSFDPGTFRVAGIEGELQVRDPFQVLLVRGVRSEEEAERFLHRLVRALTWIAVDAGIGIRLTRDLQKIQLQDTPAPPTSIASGAFGIGDEGRPAIYPDERQVRFAFAYPITALQSTPIEWFTQRLEDAMNQTSAEDAVLDDPMLRLAVDLFVNSYFEQSPVATFLLRITVLEVLKNQRDQPAHVQGLIDRFRDEIADLVGMGNLPQDMGESIKGSLERLRKESIGSAIRTLVASTLGTDAAKSATDLYTIRGALVHEGKISEEEIQRQLPELTELVADLLRARLRLGSD